jgi:hypothetical protein
MIMTCGIVNGSCHIPVPGLPQGIRAPMYYCGLLRGLHESSWGRENMRQEESRLGHENRRHVESRLGRENKRHGGFGLGRENRRFGGSLLSNLGRLKYG